MVDIVVVVLVVTVYSGCADGDKSYIEVVFGEVVEGTPVFLCVWKDL